MLSYLFILGSFALAAGYYFLYFKRIRDAGGREAFAEQYNRGVFGLDEGEKVVQFFTGCVYLGPLDPATQRDTGDRVVDFALGQTWRGAEVHIAVTDRGRFVLAQEGDGGMRPMSRYTQADAPSFATAEEAFPGHPSLPQERDRPVRTDGSGKGQRATLVRITTRQGTPMLLWTTSDAVAALNAWAADARAPSTSANVPAP